MSGQNITEENKPIHTSEAKIEEILKQIEDLPSEKQTLFLGKIVKDGFEDYEKIKKLAKRIIQLIKKAKQIPHLKDKIEAFDEFEKSFKQEISQLLKFSSSLKETIRETDFKKEEITEDLIRETIKVFIEGRDLRQRLEKTKGAIENIIAKYSEAPEGKVFISSEIQKISDKLFKKLLRKEDYKGRREIRGLQLIGEGETIDLGLAEVWQTGDVEFFVKHTDLIKLKSKAPKVYVSQDKNIKLLLALVEKQQFNKEEKKAEAVFTLKEYAKLRGYTEEEIKRGGKFIEEIKRDLYTGAYTTYRIGKIKINGKEYIAHGFPNFYTLFEPKDPKGEWRIRFNNFYAENILKILNGEAKQYFTHYLKEIADRNTTEKPYLHFFYNQIVSRRQRGKITIPKKIGNLLREMGVAEKILRRPKECFEVLKECLVYIAENYPEELEGIHLYSDLNKQKQKTLPLSTLKGLKDFTYQEFKKLLRAIDIEDIREAFISFIRPIRETEEPNKFLLPEKIKNGRDLISQIMDWIDKNINWEKMKEWTREGTEKYLKDCLKILGYQKLEELFKEKAQAPYPNAVEFLKTTLPEAIREKKAKEEGFKNVKEFLKDFLKET